MFGNSSYKTDRWKTGKEMKYKDKKGKDTIVDVFRACCNYTPIK